MLTFKKIISMILFIFGLLFISVINANINIVSAENFYGEIVKEIGGPYVNVISILNNPNQDPHLFTTSASTAVAITNADIIIYNGVGYDPWLQSLLTIKESKNRIIINVGKLIKAKDGDNPHIWYKPETIPIFVQNFTDTLTQLDPAHRYYYQQQMTLFIKKYQNIFEMVNKLKQQYQTVPVIATEPVFNYMADSIGLQMHGKEFQISIMNDQPPSVTQIKQFEDDLNQHRVHVLIYNNQVVNPLTKKMLALAEKNKIPIIGVSEMMPPSSTYVNWVMNELKGIEKALKEGKNVK